MVLKKHMNTYAHSFMNQEENMSPTTDCHLWTSCYLASRSSKLQHLFSQGLGVPQLLPFTSNSNLTCTNIAHYLHLN